MRLHAIESRDDGRRIAKRRRWFAPALIGPGNLYLRWIGAGVRVLPERDWLARERAMNRGLYAVECEVDGGGWLILPRWPGVVLEHLGSDPTRPPEDRLRGVSAAGLALGSLHRRGLAHGDATTRNVLFDPDTSQARWFDFDTAHLATIPDAWRRADDLRAFLYSSVEAMADLPVPDVFATVRAGYGENEPWVALRLALTRGPIHSSAFHLVQASTSTERRRRLEALILRVQ